MPRHALPVSPATDSISRRIRFSRPNPLVSRLMLTEADYLLFAVIDRHGPLPSHYLYEFTKHLRRDTSHLQNRLTEFYNGEVAARAAGPYLTRPPQQFAAFEARYQHLVYDLAPRAKLALAEHGTLARYSNRNVGPFVHRLMSACVSASIELAAGEAGIRYIFREEIFSRLDCKGAKLSANPLAIPLPGAGQKLLIPDDLFGLHYPQGGYRFFALEADRHTESIRSGKGARNSFAGKLTGYSQVLTQRLHNEWWGVPNLTVLTVTTNARHAANLLGHVRAVGHSLDRFCVAVEPSFGANWRVPKHLLTGLLLNPWATPSGERVIGRA